ncbi:hypothetical protein M9H77_21659 [Catharanthus roseus]|uniref:Uncharacterized protein n=1 Tax=Catharanthus roseus TaxID=4058 RepID=A0ACC0ANN7_CATRO|nr:hypothetical protein M9H77_21659 [Catharanthus roseus]
MKTSFPPGLKFVENQVNGRVRGMHYRGGCGRIDLRLHRVMLYGGVRPPSGESGGARHQGWSQGRPEAALMCLDSLRLPSYARNPHIGLARQYQSVARGVEELKKGKSSSTMEQRVGDNIGRPQVRGGRRGGLGGRGHNRPQEEFPRHESWHDDNLYEDYGDIPSNVGQA